MDIAFLAAWAHCILGFKSFGCFRFQNESGQRRPPSKIEVIFQSNQLVYSYSSSKSTAGL